MLDGPLARSRAKAKTRLPIANEALQMFGEALFVSGGEKPTCATLLHQFRIPASACGDHRQA